MAAIVYAGSSSATANASVYNSSSIPAATGDVLVVFVAASGTVQRPAVVTTSNQPAASSFFLCTSALWGASANSLYAFVQRGRCTASSATASTWVTFDCTGDAATGAIINVARLTSFPRADPSIVRQCAVSSNLATSTRPVVTLASTTLVTSAVVGAVGMSQSSIPMSPPGGWTEYVDTDGPSKYPTPTTGMEFCGNIGSNSTAISWGTSTSSVNCAIVVEFRTDAPDPMPFMAAFAEHQSLY